MLRRFEHLSSSICCCFIPDQNLPWGEKQHHSCNFFYFCQNFVFLSHNLDSKMLESWLNHLNTRNITQFPKKLIIKPAHWVGAQGKNTRLKRRKPTSIVASPTKKPSPKLKIFQKHPNRKTSRMRRAVFVNIFVQRNFPQMFLLFTVPYAMIQVSIQPSFVNEFRHRQFRSVSAESLSATRWTRIENIAVEGWNDSIVQSACELLCCKFHQEKWRMIR